MKAWGKHVTFVVSTKKCRELKWPGKIVAVLQNLECEEAESLWW